MHRIDALTALRALARNYLEALLGQPPLVEGLVTLVHTLLCNRPGLAQVRPLTLNPKP